MIKTNDEIKQLEFKVHSDSVLFFDMDGTLVDTNYSNFLSYKNAIQDVTKSDYNLIYQPETRFNRSTLKAVVPDLPETKYDEIIRKKEECYDHYIYEAILFPRVADILIKYSKTNRTVLVTNCRKNRAQTTLNHFGLAEKFTDAFYRQFSDKEEKINKFQNAITKLGVSPDVIIAFENEEVEIADAIQAGIKIINPIID